MIMGIIYDSFDLINLYGEYKLNWFIEFVSRKIKMVDELGLGKWLGRRRIG